MRQIRTVAVLLFRWLWASVAGICILAALLVGVLRLLLPLAPKYLGTVEQWLSDATRRTITIESLSCDWAQGGPLCTLGDITLSGDGGAPGLTLPRAELSVNLLLWVFTEQRLFELRVRQADIALTRTADEQWRIEALGISWPGAEPSAPGEVPWLIRGGRLTLADSSFRLTDQKRDREIALYADTVTLTRRGSGVHLSGRLAPAELPEALIEVVLDTGAPEPGAVAGPFSLYVGTTGLPLKALAPIPPLFGFRSLDGALDFEIWARVVDGELLRMHGNTRIRKLRVRGEDLDTDLMTVEPRYAAESIGLEFEWGREGDAWRLGVSELEVIRRGRTQTGELTIVHLPDHDEGPDQLLLTGLQAADVADLLITSGQMPGELRDALYNLSPHGLLERLELVVASDDPLDPVNHLRLVGADLGWSSYGGLPGISGASVDLRHAGDRGMAQVALTRGVVAASQFLRGPVFVDRLGLNAQWQFAEDYSVYIGINELAGDGFTVAGEAEMRWPDLGTPPDVNVTLSLNDVDVAGLNRFWPTRISPRLLSWLNNGLLGGTITQGGVLLRGNLGDFPFLDQDGVFEITALVEDGRMNYRPGWPEVRNADVEARFEGVTMHIEGTGETAGIGASRAAATIADLRMPLLEIRVDALAERREAINFLRLSPIGDLYGDYLNTIDIDGPVDIDVALDIPLTRRLDRMTTVTGTATPRDARILIEDWNVEFADVTGPIRFTRDSVTSNGITATFDDHPVDLALRIGQSVTNPESRLEADLRGRLPARSVFHDYPTLDTVLDRFDGESDWAMDLTLDRDQALARLHIESDLQGTAVYLPEPVGKAADESRTMRVEMTIPETAAPIRLWYGEDAAAMFSLLDDGVRGRLSFGSTPQALPELPGIHIDGRIERLDWADWVDDLKMMLPGDAASQTALAVEELDLEVGWLRTMGRRFTDLTLHVERVGETYEAQLESADAVGSVRLPTDYASGATLFAEFEKLHWPDAAEGDEVDTGLIEPSDLPAISFYARDARLEDFPLGELRVEAYPVDVGLRLDSLESRSDVAHLTGAGDWRKIDGAEFCDFDLNLTTNDLGVFLSLFGVEGQVEGGQTIASLDLQWDGGLTDFSAETLNGEVELSINGGSFPEVRQGAGKLLGLLSFRRLALDFSDLASSGMAFDSINATLQLQNGQAYTNDLRLVGPSADILVEGRIGLDVQDYDMVLTVRPKVSTALPLVGALAGGGTVAAAMFLVEGIMSDPLSRLSEVHYSVIGPWDDPDIVLLPPVRADDATPTPGTAGVGE